MPYGHNITVKRTECNGSSRYLLNRNYNCPELNIEILKKKKDCYAPIKTEKFVPVCEINVVCNPDKSLSVKTNNCRDPCYSKLKPSSSFKPLVIETRRSNRCSSKRSPRNHSEKRTEVEIVKPPSPLPFPKPAPKPVPKPEIIQKIENTYEIIKENPTNQIIQDLITTQVYNHDEYNTKFNQIDNQYKSVSYENINKIYEPEVQIKEYKINQLIEPEQTYQYDKYLKEQETNYVHTSIENLNIKSTYEPAVEYNYQEHSSTVQKEYVDPDPIECATLCLRRSQIKAIRAGNFSTFD